MAWHPYDPAGQPERTPAESAAGQTPLSGSSVAGAPGEAMPGGEGGEGAERMPGAGAALEARIIDALKTVYDPEIPVDIYELGLIYDVEVEDGHVRIRMTLTAPGCPVAGSMPGMVEEVVSMVEGVRAVEVELVWDPPWDPSMMSEAARLELGMF